MPATEAPPKSPIDPHLVIPFVNALRGLFTTMVKVDVTIGKPYMKTSASTGYDVAGVIGFSGQMIGSIAASFSRSAAVKLVEAFAGVAMEPDSPDFTDAVGELANMIAGQAKGELGLTASISTPCVITGRGYSFAPLSGVPCVVIPCSSAYGDFAVEICVQRKAA